jgi:hypothetical protein
MSLHDVCVCSLCLLRSLEPSDYVNVPCTKSVLPMGKPLSREMESKKVSS